MADGVPRDTATDKPTTASAYRGAPVQRIREVCLYIATLLGSSLEEEIVIAGGLVPSLLIPQDHLPDGAPAHVGTTDLDLGLSLALFDESRYHDIAAQLRRAGFQPGFNQQGNRTPARWTTTAPDGTLVRVDFLIPPGRPTDEGGKLVRLEGDFAAFVIPGLELAWRDRQRITLTGRTLLGEQATRDVWVCGAGAFVVLKALAFRDRGERKDAYDLYYVVRNFGAGPGDVGALVRLLSAEHVVKRALTILREDFTSVDATGPQRVAMFLEAMPDDEIEADVVAFVAEFLNVCG